MRKYKLKEQKWNKSKIMRKLGPLFYEVREEDTEKIYRRHVDQLLKIKNNEDVDSRKQHSHNLRKRVINENLWYRKNYSNYN